MTEEEYFADLADSQIEMCVGLVQANVFLSTGITQFHCSRGIQVCLLYLDFSMTKISCYFLPCFSDVFLVSTHTSTESTLCL